MEARDLLRRLIELLLEADGIIGELLDAATQLEDEGTFTPLEQRRRRRPRSRTPRRRTPVTVQKSPSARPAGVNRIELAHDRSRVRVIIPGGENPIWMSPQRAALLRALAEPSGQSDDRFVPFKTVEQLQRRIEQLTSNSLKPHSVVASIWRLRKKTLRDRPDLIETRDSHASGETTAYRFLLLASGQIIEHPPDDSRDATAIDPATGGDR